MGLLDWWRMGQFDPNSVYNVAPGGTFTTMMGPNPPPPDPPLTPAPPGSGPIATIMGGAPKQPEIQTDPDASRTVAPPPLPPVGVPKQPEILTDPDASRTVAPPPPTSSKVPEVLTKIAPATPGGPTADPRLIPTPASTATPAAQAGNYWDKVMQLQKEGKLGPMISQLAKATGHGANSAPPAPQPIHFGEPRMATPHIPQGAEAMMGEIRKNLAKFGPKPKKVRQDDPHDREQETYDFRRMKRGM